MTIQKDAGELLAYAYNKYNEGNGINNTEFEEESKWEKQRIRNALTYLRDKGLVKATFFLGGNFYIERLYPTGIDIIENQEIFKDTFGFTINLGVLQFSWQKREE